MRGIERKGNFIIDLRCYKLFHCTVNFPVLDLALFWIISLVLPTHFYKNVTNETKHTCSERAIIEILKHVKIIVPCAGSIR